ncbi:hypothetical protein HYH03_018590 [Edaphochlamys debaryana]|uniref:Uncharacterized protein n=1 Tax=Edaphochlamys debaryana TaxID=47281 RepID=A0A835XGR0_9CHLO|nr:hypothetical protein HYH03_018590 [Edaphochlamys debaryana]|eukprot:KAG2482483.1 hypothetical protein HYH03_018590 [Edaphochlamys debaryana]
MTVLPEGLAGEASAQLKVLHSGSQRTVLHVAGLLRLLHAADTFPRGGLYGGYYAHAAALRYEQHWVRVLATQNAGALPPMDVAWAWWVHRQSPAAYAAQLRQAGLALIHPFSPHQAFGFSAANAHRYVWRGAAGLHPQWPPPPPGSSFDLLVEQAAAPPLFATELAGCMSKFSWQLRSWLRPHFLEEAFLQRAGRRYVRFLRLQAAHASTPLVPTADIALIWHSHLGLSADYAAACAVLNGPGREPLRPAYVDLGNGLDAAYRRTAALYESRYGEPYDSAATAWLPGSVPYVLDTPGSPVALCRTIVDVNPQLAQQLLAADRAARVTGSASPSVATTAVPPRAGAYLLYLAWLAGRRAAEAAASPCCCVRLPLPGRRALARRWMLRHAAAALVSVAYFVDFPADHRHPYLQAIAVRPSPTTEGKGAEARAEVDAASSADASSSEGEGSAAEGHAAAAAAAAGRHAAAAPPPRFAPADPEAYLCGQSHCLGGLAAVLLGGAGAGAGMEAATGAKAPPPHGAAESPSPLWALVAQPRGAERFQRALTAAWTKAQKYGVAEMQRRFHSCLWYNGNDGVYYFGGSGYYVSYLMWYNGTHKYNYEWMLYTNPTVFSGGLTTTYHPLSSGGTTGRDAAPAKCGAAATGAGGCGGCGGGGDGGGGGGCGGGGCGGGGGGGGG